LKRQASLPQNARTTGPLRTPARDRFLRNHLLWPTLVFVVLATLGTTTSLDPDIARRWFYDAASGQWLGKGTVWADVVLHRGGRYLMRLVGVTALVAWALSWRVTRLRPWRRATGYVALCMALVPLLVGGLKETTNVDCPWDLQGFGGDRPFVHIFEDRPDGLPRAACFPGAHSSSAFALFSLYFLGLGLGRRRLAVAGFAVAAGLGLAFSFTQQARGAHFLSHDLWSAFIAWMICLALYRWAFRGRLTGPPGAVNP
jgi:membrane-associated PAP2 superfamily phosphatase